jgi:hypothetical protein
MGFVTIIAASPIDVVLYVQNFVKWQYRSHKSSSEENRNTTRHDFQSFAPRVKIMVELIFVGGHTLDMVCGT